METGRVEKRGGWDEGDRSRGKGLEGGGCGTGTRKQCS